jgi:hypothetical protein
MSEVQAEAKRLLQAHVAVMRIRCDDKFYKTHADTYTDTYADEMKDAEHALEICKKSMTCVNPEEYVDNLGDMAKGKDCWAWVP